MTVYGYEVANDYTEVDSGLPAVFTLAGSRFTYQVRSDTDGLYAWKDFTASYFDDDFEIKFKWIATANNKSATYPYRVMMCSMVNNIEDWKVNTDASKVQIGVTHYTDATKHYLAPVKSVDDETTKGTGIEVSYNTMYYIKLVRDSETTLTLSVYSDSTYETQVGVDSALTIDDTDYRYFMSVQNYNHGADTTGSLGYVENISINKYTELIGWAAALTEVENRILDYIKAIDNDNFDFTTLNCGTRVVDAEDYPICRLLFIKDSPEPKNYVIADRVFRFLLIVDTQLTEEMTDASVERDWVLQKELIGAIVDLLDLKREDNPYWSLLTYDVNKDIDDEESIYDSGTTKIYLDVTHSP